MFCLGLSPLPGGVKTRFKITSVWKQLNKLRRATHQLIQHFKMHASIFNDNYMKHTGHFGLFIKNIQSQASDLAWFDT